jgi:hypothetical protein
MSEENRPYTDFQSASVGLFINTVAWKTVQFRALRINAW